MAGAHCCSLEIIDPVVQKVVVVVEGVEGTGGGQSSTFALYGGAVQHISPLEARLRTSILYGGTHFSTSHLQYNTLARSLTSLPGHRSPSSVVSKPSKHATDGRPHPSSQSTHLTLPYPPPSLPPTHLLPLPPPILCPARDHGLSPMDGGCRMQALRCSGHRGIRE